MRSALDDSEIQQMTVDERLDLIGRLWDSLVDEGAAPNLTPAQEAELDRRIDASQADPNRGAPWEEVKLRLRSRR
jgi:putative addiction module component (TIGR02574 family)